MTTIEDIKEHFYARIDRNYEAGDGDLFFPIEIKEMFEATIKALEYKKEKEK
jgi:hypothetical protein